MYTPATKMPADLRFFQWSQPTAPNPRLAAPISATDTIITVTSAPLDHTGAVVSGNFLMGIKNDQSYTETIYVPAGAVSVDGLTIGSIATPIVRGVRLEGLDYTTGDSTLAMAANQDSPVYCNISAVNFVMMINALQGGIASGGTTWKLGKETDDSIFVYAQNADVNKPYFKYDKVSDQWLYSNDGLSETPFGTGAGLTGGAGIIIGAGVVDIDLTDTNIFKATTAGAADAGKVPLYNGSGYINQTGVEIIKDTTSTGAELSKLAGTSANVTPTNLNTLTAGAASNADALHTHPTLAILSNFGSGSIATPWTTPTTITHGLGRMPKAIFVSAICGTFSGTGFCDSSAHQGSGGGSTLAIYFNLGGGISISGTIGAIGATTFQISWAATSNPPACGYSWLVM
jgi:hypothetical protein